MTSGSKPSATTSFTACSTTYLRVRRGVGAVRRGQRAQGVRRCRLLGGGGVGSVSAYRMRE